MFLNRQDHTEMAIATQWSKVLNFKKVSQADSIFICDGIIFERIDNRK